MSVNLTVYLPITAEVSESTHGFAYLRLPKHTANKHTLLKKEQLHLKPMASVVMMVNIILLASLIMYKSNDILI